jgi:hypothetical protein
VRIEGFLVDEENDIRKFRVVQLVCHQELQLLLSISSCLEVPRGARIRIQLVNILQVILSVAPTDDVKLSSNESHGVTSSHFWLCLDVGKVVAVSPGLSLGVKSVQVVEALGMRSTTAKKIQFLLHRA